MMACLRTLTIEIRPHSPRLIAPKYFRRMSNETVKDLNPDKIQVTSRSTYETDIKLSPATVAPLPLDQFKAWFEEVNKNETVKEPEAMTLSTATRSGIPSARVVLLKQVDARGFTFYTNYTSRKSQELIENPNAALVFYWKEVHRSVRVVGKVERVSREESAEYFNSRPVGSRMGAWASRQSSVVGEGVLQDRMEKLQSRFGPLENPETQVPLPDFWGGWRLIPT